MIFLSDYQILRFSHLKYLKDRAKWALVYFLNSVYAKFLPKPRLEENLLDNINSAYDYFIFFNLKGININFL